MNYSKAKFIALLDEVEKQGGTYLDNTCKRFRTFSFSGDTKKVPVDDRTFEYCGKQAMFEIPYEGEDGQPQPVVVCAVDDNIGLWPRFAGALKDAD